MRSDAKRTGTILPLASPLGSFGLPGLRFFGFATLKLLYDCCLDCHHSRCDRRDVQHGYMASRLPWIVRIMRPCIRSIGFWMPTQIEHFHNAIPHRFTAEYLFHWNTGNVGSFDAMQTSNHVPQFFDIVSHDSEYNSYLEGETSCQQ